MAILHKSILISLNLNCWVVCLYICQTCMSYVLDVKSSRPGLDTCIYKADVSDVSNHGVQ